MEHLQYLSATNRAEIINTLSTQTFDLLIIGGGITGAGIALDAASRGLKVAMIEMQDFAAGTSSRSTKLIHGGLRYLKQFEFGLVREVGKEREIVYRNAPHLVIPEKMLLPIVKGGSLNKLGASVGIYVYDWLAGVKPKERRKMFSAPDTLNLEGLLNKDILLAGAMYTEYRTDDARLVIEIVKKAAEYGAVQLNYCEAKELTYSNSLVSGAEVTDIQTGKQFNIKALKVVNAAGPWVDEVRELDQSKKGKRLHLTKGVHLVVPFDKLPVKQSLYFDAGAGRMIFAIPRNGVTYLGTTDTTYKGGLENPNVTVGDVKYILDATNAMFPTAKLKPSDVESTWSGLRPLIHEDGKSPSELSRKDEIFISHTNLISIAGGKLTGYRQMARKIVDLVLKQLTTEKGYSKEPCITHKITLSGGQFASPADIKNFIVARSGEAKQIGASPNEVSALVWKYGTNTDEIIEKAYELREADRGLSLTNPNYIGQAEIWYVIHRELALTLGDYFIRRAGMLYFDRPAIAPKLDFVVAQFAKNLGWDAIEEKHQRDYFKEEYEAVLRFDA